MATAQYNTAITQQPLLSPDDLAAAQAPFAIQPGSMNVSAYPGALLGSGAIDALNQAYGIDSDSANAAAGVTFNRNYDQQANALNNAQQGAQASTGLAALKYAQGQQAAGLSQGNQARSFDYSNANFLAQMLGLV